MVVQHNLRAMNSNRMLGLTQSTQAKSTEKLSSGYKINRAADDAAGLSISEKMRKQMRGLTQASANAQDGISAVQTAEGALTEVHDMLQRMNELATKAANGTNSESDRTAIQNEIDQLTTEIDRVSETTKFNEMYLLKGNVEGTKSEQKLAAHDAGIAGKLEELANGKTSFTMEKLKDGDTITIAGKQYSIAATGSSAAGGLMKPGDMNKTTEGYAIASDLAAKTLDATKGDSVTFDGKTYTATNKFGLDDIDWDNTDYGATFKIGDTTYTVCSQTSIHEPEALDNTSKHEVSKADAQRLMQEAIDKGGQVTALANGLKSKFNATGSITATAIQADTQFVSSLADGEITTALAAGDTITALNAAMQGSGSELTEANFLAGTSVKIDAETPKVITGTAYDPMAAKNVYDALKGAVADETVTIGEKQDAVKWTVVANDYEIDEGSFKDTIENILARIKDGDVVTSDVSGWSGTKTVIGDLGSGASSKNADTITADAAYKMIADELQKASSIGADKGKEASVSNMGDGKFSITQASVTVKDKLNFDLHVGADADMTNKITVGIEPMDAAGLGVKALKVDGLDGSNATYAIDAIADAVAKVSAQRSALGAVQNRLEHTIANLDNVVENTTSAESAIRDTDMASEMVKYSNNNILAQAGQAMLAQANQSNQGVLSLLG